MTPEAKTQRWVEGAVVGLNLCPFAAPVIKSSSLRYLVSESTTEADVLRDLLEAIEALISSEDHVMTLLICPFALESFEDFLDVIATAEALMKEAGLEGILQLAHFHPQYRFAGTSERDLENFTNRSPFPTLHILREVDISDALDSFPDPETIPEANITRLEKLGQAKIDALWRSFNAPLGE